MSLKVSEEGLSPTAEERLSHKVMSKIRSIETEGDGMKSYVTTCVALLLGRRPVCIIDEPEMCLHPPQAYNLGKFIGQYGAEKESVTIVATHSSHVLRGIIQTTNQVQVVRLTRRNQNFMSHNVPSLELAKALSNPTLRAESVLDGIFSQAVIVVEADGDRLVYQAVWETVQEEFRIDIHFTTVGGTGGIANTCSLYRTLNIPIAVIADIDILVDKDRIERVLKALVDNDTIRNSLIDTCTDIGNEILDIPPVILAEAVKRELISISEMEMNWNERNEQEIKKRLGILRNKLDRMRRLKRSGVAAYPGEFGDRINNILTQLRNHGLFIVPVGQLEEWLSEYDVNDSKSKKRAWANSAAHKIQQLGKKPGDVWQFVTDVGYYLASNPEVSAADIEAPIEQESKPSRSGKGESEKESEKVSG